MRLCSAFTSPAHKRRFVRRLFTTIADRYDLVTVVLSFGLDRRWKRRMIRVSGVRAPMRVVDLACGTGDIAFAAAGAGAHVIGVDVTLRMIEIARRKCGDRTFAVRPRFVVGDMMALPLPSGSADVVTTGYGLRNVPELRAAVDEIARLLRPGGTLLSLDFNRPEHAMVRAAYLAYLSLVGSALGWILHRDPDTYRYIPESIRRYPGARGVADLLGAAGFTEIRIIPILFGLMTLHVARTTQTSAAHGNHYREQCGLTIL